jgi:uncharacterized LabA/DUF88 family protein
METVDKLKGERVAVFIDGSNFYHSAKDTFGLFPHELEDADLFRKLVEFIKGGRLLIVAYYYNAPLDVSYNKEIYSRQQSFFARLNNIPGIQVVLCRMRKIRKDDGTAEYAVKGDDIRLAVDMVSGAYENQYDTAVIVSGDGDFVPVVEKVRKLGKTVENAYISVSRSSALSSACNTSYSLEEFLRKFYYKEKDK